MSAASAPSVETDASLVRAPVGAVYATLTDVDGWPDWWPDCRTSRVTSTGGDGVPVPHDRHRLVLGRGPLALRLEMSVSGWRHDVGMQVELVPARAGRRSRARDAGADAAVRTEWWLEPVAQGVVVHHLVRASGSRGQRRRLRRRVALGMQALKDHLELAVAVALGQVP